MHAAGSFTSGSYSTAATALAFGFLVLTAFFVGRFFKAVRLPKLTGYIATGIVAGPYVAKLVTEPVAQSLSIFGGVAVSLISLSGGLEMEFRSMRPLFKTIRWVTLVAVLGTTLLLALTAFLVRDLLPFMRTLDTAQALVISLVLAIVMVAQSPAVVMAIRTELAADGPASKTALGVVIIADLVVILLFAVASSVGKSVLGGGADVGETVKALAWEIFGSVGAGVLIGGVLAVYLRKVKEGGGLFIMAVCLVIAEVGRRLHLDALLVSLTAGIAIRNFTRTGDKLHHEIEASSLPIYIVFFAVAGATIHLSVLKDVWLPAIIFVVVRAVGFLVGSNLATRIAGAPPEVRRYAGFGLLPQAGLALALSMLFAKTFPEFGADASALTLGIVAINEIVAPALDRLAVVRSGEAGKAAPAEAPAAVAPAPSPERAPAPGDARSPEKPM
ncbi:MAG: cation:proton antiporter [Myxococcales bacterium]|nr:cation:proton antiporter [Myxococcales bacterium]